MLIVNTVIVFLHFFIFQSSKINRPIKQNKTKCIDIHHMQVHLSFHFNTTLLSNAKCNAYLLLILFGLFRHGMLLFCHLICSL